MRWGDLFNLLDNGFKSDELKAEAVKILKNAFLYDKELQWDFCVTEENIKNFTFEDVEKFLAYGKRQMGITNTRKPRKRFK